MKTQVIFRKFPEGEVIALFPNEIADANNNIMSYQRVGQHGAASPALALELEIPTKAECKALKKELKSIGYKLEDYTYGDA
jgi:hypothetical protein